MQCINGLISKQNTFYMSNKPFLTSLRNKELKNYYVFAGLTLNCCKESITSKYNEI